VLAGQDPLATRPASILNLPGRGQARKSCMLAAAVSGAVITFLLHVAYGDPMRGHGAPEAAGTPTGRS